MIRVDLDIQKYCGDCPNFSPDTDCYKDYADDRVIDHVVTITCKYRGHCKHLSKFHEKRVVANAVDISEVDDGK